MKYLIIAVSLLILCAASCKKNKGSKEDQLPPITQTGANTFGCLINGKVWIPKGYNGTGTPNPKISIEFFNGKMFLGIVTSQLENGNSQGYMDIYFFDSVLSADVYNYPDKMNFSASWPKVINGCFTPAGDTTVKKWGQAIITKFDNINKIVSGIFSCKFKAPSCDTVFISNGRFDLKIP